jgi:histidinol-phosphate aminotransferase
LIPTATKGKYKKCLCIGRLKFTIVSKNDGGINVELKFRDHLKSYCRATYVKDDGNVDTDGRGFIDCALGINPFGCSPLLKGALGSFDVTCLNKYPDLNYRELKKDLVSYWRGVAEINSDNIRLGCGSMDILERLNKIFIDRGAKVLGYCPQFTDYMTDVESCGGVFEYAALVPEKNYRFDGEALLSKLDDGHRLIYIDNPNNHTGQVIPLPEIQHVVEEAAKKGVCVVVDEAYGDYVGKEESAISIVMQYQNLAVVRSFSKGFGLAGARVGYMVTGRLIADYYSKVELLFIVSTFGQFAVQVALKDEGFLRDSIRKVRNTKHKILDTLKGIRTLETDLRVPIMTLQHPSEKVDLHEEFYKQGVLTEPGEGFVELGKNSVRLRVPVDAEGIIKVIKNIEEGI